MPSQTTDLQDDLQDVAAGVLMPFDDQGDVRFDGVVANAEYLQEHGIRLVLANANISEYHSLTPDEQIQIVETVVGAAAPETTVLAGVGGSLHRARETAAAHARSGADALMVMPPDNTFAHEQGLLTYYEDLGTRTDLLLVPYVRELKPRAETIHALADLPMVAGIKYALEDIERFVRAISAAEGEVVWMCGMGEPLAPAFWLEGAEGFTSGVGNVIPEVGLALRDALREGDWQRAIEIRNVSLPLQKLRGATGERNMFAAASVPVLKEALRLAGGHGGHVRPPLAELSAVDRERVREEVERIEAFVDVELDATREAPSHSSDV